MITRTNNTIPSFALLIGDNEKSDPLIKVFRHRKLEGLSNTFSILWTDYSLDEIGKVLNSKRHGCYKQYEYDRIFAVTQDSNHFRLSYHSPNIEEITKDQFSSQFVKNTQLSFNFYH